MQFNIKVKDNNLLKNKRFDDLPERVVVDCTVPVTLAESADG